MVASDLSGLNLVAIQMDGLHLAKDMVMVGAVGIDTDGNKHVLGVTEEATENAATVQALLENLIDRGLATDRAYLFILDGAKALSRAVRNTFGDAAEIQRCQVHKGRNVIERLPKEHHAAAKIALRQAWTLSDPAKAQRLLENLAKKYDDICPGAARSVREGMPEMLTLTRLGLPDDLRKSLASTNIMESVNAVIARASRNVTRWRNASMGLRWTAAGMLMAQKGFRRVNGHMHLPKLADALDRIYEERMGRKSGRVAAGPQRDARVVQRDRLLQKARQAPGRGRRPQCHSRSLPESAEIRLRAVGIPKCGHRKERGTLDTSGSDRIYEDRGGVASRFQHRSGHSQIEHYRRQVQIAGRQLSRCRQGALRMGRGNRGSEGGSSLESAECGPCHRPMRTSCEFGHEFIIYPPDMAS